MPPSASVATSNPRPLDYEAFDVPSREYSQPLVGVAAPQAAAVDVQGTPRLPLRSVPVPGRVCRVGREKTSLCIFILSNAH